MLLIRPVPDGLYHQLAARCRGLGIEVRANEFDMPVSLHWCHAGGHRYEVCPPSPDEGSDCLAAGCVSYDPSWDASVLFEGDQ